MAPSFSEVASFSGRSEKALLKCSDLGAFGARSARQVVGVVMPGSPGGVLDVRERAKEAGQRSEAESDEAKHGYNRTPGRPGSYVIDFTVGRSFGEAPLISCP